MQFSICNITGTKEKKLDSLNDKKELWNRLLGISQSPVKQKYFLWQLPESAQLLFAGETAMQHYAYFSAGKTKTFAISKKKFFCA
jgi:hypothetical protein